LQRATPLGRRRAIPFLPGFLLVDTRRINILETGRRRVADIRKSPEILKIPAALAVLQVPHNLLSGDGYTHGAVDHRRKEWAWTDRVTGTRRHVNGVENFWKIFKDSVNSTHIHISEKYMDRYLGEFQFRSNHREMKNAMFDLFDCGALTTFARAASKSARSIWPIPRACSSAANSSKRFEATASRGLKCPFFVRNHRR